MPPLPPIKMVLHKIGRLSNRKECSSKSMRWNKSEQNVLQMAARLAKC